MPYEYIPTTAPTTPFPLYAGWGFFLDLFGQQNMRGPLRLTAGAVWAPSLTFAGDNRTGIYQPYDFAIGWAVFGFLRFLVDADGVSYFNETGYRSRFNANELGDDQVLTLPNETGTIALKEDDQIVLVNDSGGPVVRGTPVIASGTGFTVAGAGDMAIGLAAEDIADSEAGIIQINGKFWMNDWTPIAGVASLTLNELYSTATAGTVTAGDGSVIFQALTGQDVKILGAGSGGGGGAFELTREQFTVSTSVTFTLAAPMTPESMMVYLNGVGQTVDVNYTTDGSVVEFLHHLRVGHKVEVRGVLA